mmetsp:Transcript_36372/g.117597  ORF Transcript_36372/g.117597 Transcript_36372/m.117597 type:complete len:234 (-) Transcript_36372:485-1186(-)
MTITPKSTLLRSSSSSASMVALRSPALGPRRVLASTWRAARLRVASSSTSASAPASSRVSCATTWSATLLLASSTRSPRRVASPQLVALVRCTPTMAPTRRSSPASRIISRRSIFRRSCRRLVLAMSRFRCGGPRISSIPLRRAQPRRTKSGSLASSIARAWASRSACRHTARTTRQMHATTTSLRKTSRRSARSAFCSARRLLRFSYSLRGRRRSRPLPEITFRALRLTSRL